MEENMIESNDDPELILGKVQRKMTGLFINRHCSLVSRNGESLGKTRGLFYGNPTNVRNTPYVAQVRRDQEIV